MPNPRSETMEFNERFYRALRDHITAVMSSADTKIPDEEYFEVSVRSALDSFASGVAANIRQRERELIQSTERMRHDFIGRLREYWGVSLDLYYTIAVCLEELGSDFNDSRRKVAAENNDFVFEALTGLHARACRTAFEVHHLLSGGFPMGALARCRTLHELAVAAALIQQYGRQPEHHDLAERYILRDHVMNWKDALEYQKRCKDIGYDPFSEEEMAEFKTNRDAVVEKFGTSFKEENGWAAGLVPGQGRVGFRDLESLANLSHLRAYYKWASHEVHADAKGWRLNHGRRGEASYLSSGHVNFGLADPGQLALNSLSLCTALLVLSASPPELSDLVAVMAIRQLIDEADQAFVDAENSVRAAEEHIQAELHADRST